MEDFIWSKESKSVSFSIICFILLLLKSKLNASVISYFLKVAFRDRFYLILFALLIILVIRYLINKSYMQFSLQYTPKTTLQSCGDYLWIWSVERLVTDFFNIATEKSWYGAANYLSWDDYVQFERMTITELICSLKKFSRPTTPCDLAHHYSRISWKIVFWAKECPWKHNNCDCLHPEMNGLLVMLLIWSKILWKYQDEVLRVCNRKINIDVDALHDSNEGAVFYNNIIFQQGSSGWTTEAFVSTMIKELEEKFNWAAMVN
jgi:hypothetical protein